MKTVYVTLFVLFLSIQAQATIYNCPDLSVTATCNTYGQCVVVSLSYTPTAGWFVAPTTPNSGKLGIPASAKGVHYTVTETHASVSGLVADCSYNHYPINGTYLFTILRRNIPTGHSCTVTTQPIFNCI